MLPKLKEKHRELRSVFEKHESIACVYLFGSCVKGELMQESDIDFALLLADGSCISSFKGEIFAVDFPFS